MPSERASNDTGCDAFRFTLRGSCGYNEHIIRPERGMTVLELLVAGGWMMVPLLLCSIVGLAICIERLYTLNIKKIAPPHLLATVWKQLKKGELDAAKLRTLRQSSPLGRILAAGLANAYHGRDVMKESIQDAASHVVHDMERYLTTLGTIAAIAPLLGLLGSVMGIITVFTEIMVQGSGNASVLAGGISEALISTAAGLTVAIPALVMHRYFIGKIDGIVVELEQETIKLIDALHSEANTEAVA
jgi:biopolymer transport protein ExbB